MVKTITVRPSARESLIEPNFRQDDALGRRIMEDVASLVRSAEEREPNTEWKSTIRDMAHFTAVRALNALNLGGMTDRDSAKMVKMRTEAATKCISMLRRGVERSGFSTVDATLRECRESAYTPDQTALVMQGMAICSVSTNGPALLIRILEESAKASDQPSAKVIGEFEPIIEPLRAMATKKAEAGEWMTWGALSSSSSRYLRELNEALVKAGYEKPGMVEALLEGYKQDAILSAQQGVDGERRKQLAGELTGMLVTHELEKKLGGISNSTERVEVARDVTRLISAGIGYGTREIQPYQMRPELERQQLSVEQRALVMKGMAVGWLVNRGPVPAIGALRNVASYLFATPSGVSLTTALDKAEYNALVEELREGELKELEDREVPGIIGEHLPLINYVRAWVLGNSRAKEVVGLDERSYMRFLDDAMLQAGFSNTIEGPYYPVTANNASPQSKKEFETQQAAMNAWVKGRDAEEEEKRRRREETIAAAEQKKRDEAAKRLADAKAEQLRRKEEKIRVDWDSASRKRVEGATRAFSSEVNAVFTDAGNRWYDFLVFPKTQRLAGKRDELTAEYNALVERERQGELNVPVKPTDQITAEEEEKLNAAARLAAMRARRNKEDTVWQF